MPVTVAPTSVAQHRPTIVCPLAFERRALVKAGLTALADIVICGPGAAAVHRWAASFDPRGGKVILAGVAGSLRENLDTSRAHVVIAATAPDAFFQSPDNSPGLVAASTTSIIRTRAAKLALAKATGADLVDQESLAFIEEARRHAWNWTIVRGISDDLDHDLPAGAENWVDPLGRTRMLSVLGSILKRPATLPAVLHTGSRSRDAMRAVARTLHQMLNVSESSRGILVFGGTFDPPHLAHVELPQLVAHELNCDRILYIPAAINPLKTDQPPTDPAHRLAMLRLALAGRANVEIDDLELRREGPSYTVDTLEALRARYGNDVTLRLLIGSDQALAFPRWKNPERILELATPAVMLRPPLTREGFQRILWSKMSEIEADRWTSWVVNAPVIDISATEIRAKLIAGEDVTIETGPAVAAYIREHGLYQ